MQAIIQDTRSLAIPVLVNRQLALTTLEIKARLGGFLWKNPTEAQLGERVCKNGSGEIIGYDVKTRVSIMDVDGVLKHTLKTTHLTADKSAERTNPAYGIHNSREAGKYHGKLSSNWRKAKLTPRQIVDELSAGHAIAPGEFIDKKGVSRRSRDSIQHRQMFLFDGDEWDEAHPAPASINELLHQTCLLYTSPSPRD